MEIDEKYIDIQIAAFELQLEQATKMIEQTIGQVAALSTSIELMKMLKQRLQTPENRNED